ncbi:MAG: FAD-binding oxidoreductase [Burkholderiaceae bacterium]|nr:FAD-binding oxidoreductase [Burkholderiaceae bacterium]
MDSTQQDHDVVIVGGGLIGLATALALQENGQAVALVDPGLAKVRASYGNAGVIGRASIFPMANPAIWHKLLRYAMGGDPALRIRYQDFPTLAGWLPRFLSHATLAGYQKAATALDPLVAQAYDTHMALAASVGAAHLIQKNGWIRVYRSQAAFDSSLLERRILAMHGVAADALQGDAIYDLEPSLRHRFSHALLFPDTAAVNTPGRLLECYLQAFLAQGGSLINSRATELMQQGSGVLVGCSAGLIKARYAVLAAGAWSGELARRMGYKIPLIGERGYHMHYSLAEGSVLNRPIHDAAGAYVMSPMDQGVRILTGVELAHPDSPPNYVQMSKAIQQAGDTLPLGQPQDNTVWMGSRPSTPDSLPVIGFPARHNRIVFAFGHGHIGMSTAPITGRLVSDLLLQRPTSVPLGPFSPDRFSR